MYIPITNILVALVYTSFISIVVNAEGEFQLQLLKFKNDDGRAATGKCCQPSGLVDDTCTQPCHTAFRVCLNYFQQHVGAKPDCAFGVVNTPILGDNSFLPMTNSYFRNDPIAIKFDFRWPRSFSLVVEAIHRNRSSKVDITGPSDVLISRLVMSEYQHPARHRNDVWQTPKPYSHRGTELYYSYRVVCLENTYGPACATYCRPRNDRFGHFKCDNEGKKTCLPGWTDDTTESYCTKAVCEDGCSNGACIRPNFCKCNAGWGGKDCSQCITRYGCEHGTCTVPSGCDCEVGWGGHYCNQDLNYCTNNRPCLNGASCANTGLGSYTCNCLPGFIGDNCEVEIDECMVNPCKNNATCVDLINDYQCVCSPKFSGKNCDISATTCADLPCLHGGVCLDDNDRYKCNCTNYWFGTNCEKPVHPCSRSPCQNNGRCAITSKGLNCRCKSGFSGKYCHKVNNPCRTLPCLNGGTCLESPKASLTCSCHLCICPLSFRGSRCQYNESRVTKNLPAMTSNLSLPSSQYRHPLNTSQWIAICVGSGLLVFALALVVGCLLHHKRAPIDIQHQFDNSIKGENSSESDLPEANCSSNSRTVFNKRSKSLSSQNSITEVYYVQSRFPEKREYDAKEELRENGQRERTEGWKNVYASSSKQKGRRKTQNKPMDFCAETKNAEPMLHHIPKRSGPISSPRLFHSHTFERSLFLNERNNTANHPDSRLPTYEEVCEEDDTLLQQGYQSSKDCMV